MDTNHLHILWTNADPGTAMNMVMMYARNSITHQWWEKVTVIIWGAAAKLVAEDETIQEAIKLAQHVGIKFSACISCALNYGIKDQIEALAIETIPWGEPLTELIKSKAPMLTV